MLREINLIHYQCCCCCCCRSTFFGFFDFLSFFIRETSLKCYFIFTFNVIFDVNIQVCDVHFQVPYRLLATKWNEALQWTRLECGSIERSHGGRNWAKKINEDTLEGVHQPRQSIRNGWSHPKKAETKNENIPFIKILRKTRNVSTNYDEIKRDTEQTGFIVWTNTKLYLQFYLIWYCYLRWNCMSWYFPLVVSKKHVHVDWTASWISSGKR